MDKPNILVIMSDQLRYDALGCSGNPVVRTPNIDQLAESGARFTNAYTPNPLCVPARASFTTGCYPHKSAGSKQNNGQIRAGFPTIGEEMKQRGYETYAMGKLHYTPYQPPGTERVTHGLDTVELSESGRYVNRFDPSGKLTGLEEYLDYLQEVGWGGYTRGHGLGNNDIFPAPSPIPKEHYVDTWVAERTLHHLQQHMVDSPDKPFFMWTSFPKPHSAYDPPRPYDQWYHPHDMPEPVGSAALLRERGLDLLDREYRKYGWDSLSPQAHKVIKAYYYGLVALQDELIGRIIEFLETNGLRDNTIVVFTSDHGDMLGDFGQYFKKVFYKGSVKIPLLISYPPAIQPGLVTDELAGLQDLLPTLLGLAGDPLVCTVDGIDLQPMLLEGKAVREYFVSQSNNDPAAQRYMVADKQWKYVYHTYGGVEELYDLAADPDELKNLSGKAEPESEAAKQQRNMRQYLIEWCMINGDHTMLDQGDLLRIERDREPSSATAALHPKSAGKSVLGHFGRRFV